MLEERSGFFSGYGHDLKTPLNAILGFSEMMSSEIRGPLSDDYKDYAGLINESGQDLMLLVEDILDLAKAEANAHRLDFEPVDLGASGKSVLAQMRAQADRASVKLKIRTYGEPWAHADARAVRQIWQNLVSNAIKYSDADGTVSLIASVRQGKAVLGVKDTGAGMDEADLARISEPFAQGANAKGRAGTGPGLAVVKRFTDLQNGKVVINTALGKGTQVEVILPLANPDDLVPLK
jgi:cell cycle sensor histidine kinase DivJ